MPLVRPTAAALALALATTAVAAAPSSRLALSPCQLSAPVSGERVEARCGTLEVPEDRRRPEGRRIALRVAVVRSRARSPAPDAVIFLAGGPGQAATEVFPALQPAFARVLGERDVVLVDQRGTGGSGGLSCPAVPEPARGRAIPAAEALRRVEACARALSERVDLCAYGTDAFVRDLDEVRAALGYARVDLIGASYGTRAALIYLRSFPERVRAVVLDGVAPLEMALGGTFEADAQAALDLMLTRCREDPACAARWPDLDRLVPLLLSRLGSPGRKVSFRDPLTAELREETIGADDVRNLVLGFSYAPETVALLPPLLAAAARGDLAPLAAALAISSRDLEASIARPLEFSVLCAEDVPFVEDGTPAEDARRYLGRGVRDRFREVCARWPVKAVPAEWRTPVRSDVPALLLSGEADPVTPPRWAERAALGMPNARHVVLAGHGHGTLQRGCVPRLVADFLERGTAAELDTSCAARARPAALFLDAQGGAP
jgi:pimeloyl-ACP methyl ester carboxylesterase